MAIPVFIHRWFASGAGWAYGKGGEKDLAEVARAMAPLLNMFDRQHLPQLIEQRTPTGGIVIGEAAADHESPDPRGRARGASATRVVLIRGGVSTDQIEHIRTQLRGLTLPERSGEDRGLLIQWDNARSKSALNLSVNRRDQQGTTCQPSTFQRTHRMFDRSEHHNKRFKDSFLPSHPHRQARRWAATVVMCFVVIAASALIVKLQRDRQLPDSSQPDTATPKASLPATDEVHDAALRARHHLNRWHALPESAGVSAIFDAFFRTLSTEGIPDGDLGSRDRLTEFIKRLPRKRISGGQSREELEDAERLRMLLEDLAGQLRAPPTPRSSLTELVDWVAEAVNPAWYEEKHPPDGRRLPDRPAESVRQKGRVFGWDQDEDLDGDSIGAGRSAEPNSKP